MTENKFNPYSFVNKTKTNKDENENLHKTYAKVESHLKKTPFFYDDPLYLGTAFEKNEKNDVKSFIYLIKINKIPSFGFIFSKNLGNLPNFNLLNPQKEYEYTEKIEVFLIEENFIPYEDFEKLWKFNIYLMCDLFLVAKKNLSDNFNSIDSCFVNTKNKRNYIFFPIENIPSLIEKGKDIENKVNWELINKIIQCKELNENFSKSLNEIIKDLPEESIKDYIKNTLVYNGFGNNTSYYILDIIKNPHEKKAICYLEFLFKNYNKEKIKTMNELFEKFNLTKEKAEEITISDLFMKHDLNNNQSIMYFRNLKNVYKFEINPEDSIILVNYLNHVNNFDFINKTHSINSNNSVKKKNFQLNSPNVQIISAKMLFENLIDLENYENFCKIPSIMIFIERLVMVNEFKCFHKLNCLTKHLLFATSTPSFDPIINYEVLEVVGDSILKILTTIHLIKSFPDKNEDELTQKRIPLIRNK